MIVDQKLNKQFVGVYLIDGSVDGTQLATTSKPNWFRILMTRWFLGWKWINITELKINQEKIKIAQDVKNKANLIEFLNKDFSKK